MSSTSTESEYRLNYYDRNKERIQAYQREYYKKHLRRKRKNTSQSHWKGEKIEGLVIRHENITLKFD